ncbi:MAG: transaldolase [Chloroflexota bacterium]
MRAENPLVQLQRYGQSFWYDNIHRRLFTSGELQRLIDEDGLCGMTANPTIFEKAISEGTAYDETIRSLAAEGHSPLHIYEALATEDVRQAADFFRPIYEETGGDDGFVSLEVSPALAYDTQVTIAEAHRLWDQVNRPNLMIKVPATPPGIPAIEQLLYDGLNINITLMFSLAHYDQVANAYLNALERRRQENKPLDHIASVASFFVSRIDTKVDRLLQAKIEKATSPGEREALRRLLGKAAIASAKLAYQRFKQVFNGPRFARLQAYGARLQRPLWASTSTKNPAYRDTYYVEELIGPNTVNTMPPVTVEAFRDHGVVRPTLEEKLDEAHAVMDWLVEVGIDLGQVTQELQVEGVKAFADSFEALLQRIAEKSAGLT